jgi:hypothetical protein
VIVTAAARNDGERELRAGYIAAMDTQLRAL